jgi:hypothetical protein
LTCCLIVGVSMAMRKLDRSNMGTLFIQHSAQQMKIYEDTFQEEYTDVNEYVKLKTQATCLKVIDKV